MTVEPKTNIFDAPSVEETGRQFADHLPEGRMWATKNIQGEPLYDLIQALAFEFNTVQQKIEELSREMDVTLTTELLPDWEEMVGIPDECIDQLGSLEERRALVLSRIQKLPIVTLQEFQAFVDATFPDDDIKLIPGSEYFTYTYNYEYSYLGDINEKFILVATIPFTNEYEYDSEYDYTGGPNIDKLRCLIEKIIPSNVYFLIDFITTA